MGGGARSLGGQPSTGHSQYPLTEQAKPASTALAARRPNHRRLLPLREQVPDHPASRQQFGGRQSFFSARTASWSSLAAIFSSPRTSSLMFVWCLATVASDMAFSPSLILICNHFVFCLMASSYQIRY